MNHGGGDHDMSDMGSHSGDHGGGDHDMSGHNMKDMKHGGGHHDMKDMKHGEGTKNDNPNPPVAIDAPPISADIPTGSTVALALGIAVMMGLVGGWVLRVSSPR
jgi:hypothetical protein